MMGEDFCRWLTLIGFSPKNRLETLDLLKSWRIVLGDSIICNRLLLFHNIYAFPTDFPRKK
jgi:hypothetical protein